MRTNGFELEANGAEFAASLPANEIIVDLTGTGVIDDPIDGHFVGIDYDEVGGGYFRVVVGNVSRHKKLSTAKKYLTRLVPDWETRQK